MNAEISRQPEDQSDWQLIIEESAYTLTGLIKEFGLCYSSLKSWLKCEVTPREKNKAKMENILRKVQGEKKLTRHPSFGYATPEQMEQLKTLGMGPTRDLLMATIKKQNESGGKTRY